jgi:hypothetical protein
MSLPQLHHEKPIAGNAIIENGIVVYRDLRALKGPFFYPLDAFGIVNSTPTAIMPQANGNVSPERFIEPQPQRQSAVQIAIKNFSPVWYVPAFLICTSIEHSTFLALDLDLALHLHSFNAKQDATPQQSWAQH